jgi:hypothetical protein
MEEYVKRTFRADYRFHVAKNEADDGRRHRHAGATSL